VVGFAEPTTLSHSGAVRGCVRACVRACARVCASDAAAERECKFTLMHIAYCESESM
jgi:hypothetical protein